MEALATQMTAVIPGIVTAIVTSVVTVRLSLRSFRSQKWWERKAVAYCHIVEALYSMRAYADAYRRSEETGEDIRGERKAMLEARCHPGNEEIMKAAAVGHFIINKEAATDIAELCARMEEARGSHTIYEVVTAEIVALDQCMEALRACAQKDLEVG